MRLSGKLPPKSGLYRASKSRKATNRKEYDKEYYKDYPWMKTHKHILARCKYDKNHSYYKRGIQANITQKELELIWTRDKAYEMSNPVIHRKDNNGNYTLGNCCYIENVEHKKLTKRERTKT